MEEDKRPLEGFVYGTAFAAAYVALTIGPSTPASRQLLVDIALMEPGASGWRLTASAAECLAQNALEAWRERRGEEKERS